jgi:anti-sigma factor RsiW
MSPQHPADRRLIRYLHGELPTAEVRQLRAELARDPALQARLAELHRLWQGLQVPPPTPAPFGFVPELQRIAEDRRQAAGTGFLGWSSAPAWARALAATALAAGVALGLGLGRLVTAADAADGVVLRTGTTAASGPRSPAPGDDRALPATTDQADARSAAVTPPPAGASATESTVADLGEELASFAAAGDVTLAEQYWQALEGI